MALRKLSMNNSIRYVRKDGHPHSEQTPLISKERKKNTSTNEFSQQNKKFLKNITAEGFRILK